MIQYDLINESLEEAVVLPALKYFSIFRFPLKLNEIHAWSGILCQHSMVQECMDALVHKLKLTRYKDYYSINPDIHAEVLLREKGEMYAIEVMDKAKSCGNVIHKFPYVRFVGISGSLSKGMADNNSDFDFFVVTARNRLWICRTLLHLFKKLTFITGDQHKFCMNYFVDDSALEIVEKNMFTAVELLTVIPVKGKESYEKIKQSNQWVFEIFPNASFRSSLLVDDKKYLLKSFLEGCNNIFSPEMINKKLMKFTDKRWRKKWAGKGYPMEDYDDAFKTTLHISKNHPGHFQKRILIELQKLKTW